jgi:myb proto-oncogene protein
MEINCETFSCKVILLYYSRTDNSIKNHFYSTLRRSLRRINKYLGFKNSTNQMRVLKPSILCKLVEEGQNTE